MNNIQKAFKNKAKRGLCMARGGITPGMGNDLTRSNQMGEAASEMERTRLAGEADFRARMSTPPVAAARGPLDNQVAMGEAMAGLSNTDRYKLGGSGTAAEASEIDQRNDIMKRLNAAMPEVPQLQVNRQPRPGLLGGQEDIFGMNLARGTGSLNCATGAVFREGNSFGDRPVMPAAGAAPYRPVPTRVAPPASVPQRVVIPLPAPEYPQERARPVAVAATPPGAYPGVIGVPGLMRARSAANIDARDYADGTGRIDPVEELLKRTASKYGVSNKPAPQPAPQPQPAPKQVQPAQQPQPAPERKGLSEMIDERNKRLKDAANYACGTARVGHAAGGIVRGKGGPTDDEVSMSIGGTDVNLSPREAVLPVKTVMALGGPEAVEELIEQTNGKPPVRSGLRAGGKYVDGAVPPLTPEQEMLKRAAASRAADAQARAAQEASQAARSAEAGMRTPGGGAQGAQSTMRQAFNSAGGIGNKTVGEAAEAVGQSAAKLGTKVWPAVKPVARFVGGTAKKVPYVAAAIDATDVVDVATDPNKSRWDVAQEFANKVGKWGSAGVGAGYGAKVGAAGGTAASLAFPPAAPVIIPAATALGAVVGGVGGYMTADELMRAGGHAPPSETADGLTSGIKRNIREKLGIELPGDAAFKTDETRAAHEASMNGGAGTGKIKMPVSKEQMRAAAQAQAAQVPVQTGSQGAPEPATATAADIQARSMAAEGLRSGAQREMNLPPTQQQDVVNGGSLVQRGNVGLRSIATNPAVQDAFNVANEQQGTGVTYSTVKGADGKPQVMISGGQPTKPQYISADGTPTNDWYQTKQYAESKGVQARNKQALRDIEMENARSDLASALPFYQGRGLRTMAGRLRDEEIAQKGQLTPAQREQIAIQREGLGLQRDTLDATIANRTEDNKRAAAAAGTSESGTHNKAVDDLVKSWASADGKMDDQKYTQLQKYASYFERGKDEQGRLEDSRKHLRTLMDNFAIDSMGDTEGRHWLSDEDTWNGEPTIWVKRAAKDSLRRGAPLQSVEYHDPLTGRTIYQSDVNKLSPEQRKIFREQRVYNK